ncbi:double-strand break repair protein AddB [Algihabitans albus]|uniref:double-strand break repair protein AddB n=1 Tax=Algihabitans albus TaxID=2164067 RepID=UPI000E5CFFD0|nr:double-strand break repair protein AddB [Algihabitans albus]
MEGAQPKVYSIDPEVGFVDALARGLLARSTDPLDLSRIQLLLPTRRAGRALSEAFLRVAGGQALLLPRIRPLGEIDADELLISGEPTGLDHAFGSTGIAADLPPELPGVTRQLLLARLVLRWAEQRGDTAAPAEDQAIRLAGELGRLIDSVETEGLDFAELARLAPEDYAVHWQKTLDFLRIVTDSWPEIQRDLGTLGAAERRRRLLEAQAAAWLAEPPQGPVVAAGSTGSIPATAELLKVIAGLPNGAVILPGLDREMPETAWAQVLEAPSHPQHTLARLLRHLEIGRKEVADWPTSQEATGTSGQTPATARRCLIATALWPATATSGWAEMPNDFSAQEAERALTGLRRIDCPDPGTEATTVALLLRETLDTPGKRAALVTPDRALARRVAAELRRWGLEVDDSAGRPLATTPPSAFLRLTAQMVAERLAPLPLLATLKHPLAAGGEETGRFRTQVRRLETAVLRGPRPPAGFDGLLEAARAETAGRSMVPWLQHLAGMARSFATLLNNRAAGLAQTAEAHVAFAEALAASDSEPGATRLWRGEAGEEAAAFFAELHDGALTAGGLTAARYLAVLEALMTGRAVRRRYGGHPRLAILGPLEARLQQADRLILAGLNEGTWPAETEPGPWMSRPMRAAFGLPPVERKIGLAAHDFTQAASAPEVILTRAERVEGTPTVPSRWLLRLDALCNLLGRPSALADESALWATRVEALDAAKAYRPCDPPSPTPPAAARPRGLSVTQVETWMRDPYAIYARHILKLRKLPALDEEPGAADKGLIVHDALEAFTKAWPVTLPPDAEAQLLNHGRAVFQRIRHRPTLFAFWWPRFARIAAWVSNREAERRPQLTELLSEIEGRIDIEGFELRARADRIERLIDGGLALIDYKTGTAPSSKSLRLGFSPQLPLEAVIALAGGFEGLPPAEVAELAFWRLSGGHPPGEIKTLKPGKETPAIEDLAVQARNGLAALVTRFRDPSTPYHARPRPDWAPRYSDYEHLARVKEWTAAEVEEG